MVFRILDVTGGTILLYHCEFVEASGSCSPGMSHAFILVRDGSQQSIPEDLLAHFSDLIADVCLDGGSGEFTKTANIRERQVSQITAHLKASICPLTFIEPKGKINNVWQKPNPVTMRVNNLFEMYEIYFE